MAKGKRDGLLIAGGGVAGSLAAIAMVKLRPEVPILLVEESDRFGGSTTRSFLDSEIDEDLRWLIDPMVSMRWPAYYVSFPGHSRKLRLGFNTIVAADLDRAVRETLRPDQYRLGTRIVGVRENELSFPGGEKIQADGAIDARGAAKLSMLDLGWRKSVGRDYEFPRPHRVDLPVLVDATIDQIEGLHFAYCLPLSDTRLWIEDSYISESRELDRGEMGARIEAYCALRGWRNGRLEREEAGVLPIALSDDVQALWRGGGARVGKLGLRGGFFHPSTGHGLADAVHTALLLAEQRSFDGATLRAFFEAEATQLWRKREPYRSFNAGLFEAPVWERRTILESLYRQDIELIARFYSGKLGILDRRRIAGVVGTRTGR